MHKEYEKSATIREFYKELSSKQHKTVIEWDNLSCIVRIKDPKASTCFNTRYHYNRILSGLFGRSECGQLVAIMGPTGCGKTTLLNILSARVSSGGSENIKLSGSVKVNGTIRNDSAFIMCSAYVMQDDRMYPHLTVQETLTLASHFYLPTNTADDVKAELVNAVVSELGLTAARNTIIGDEKIRGVSGGERKRTSIATLLLSQPSVLFLDEPTSGLDSFQAQSVMECMKSMAANGRLVMAAIHQPRSSIFDMFDQLLLLSCGKTVYFGPASDAASYFAGLGYSCPHLFNPSDYFLDILSPDNRTAELEEFTSSRISFLCVKWREAEIEFENSPGEAKDPAEASVVVSTFTNSRSSFDFKRFARNFRLLAWRSFTEQRRDLPTLVIKLIMTCFFSLIIGGIYSKKGHGQKIIQNHIGLLFVVVINQGFGGVLGVANTFPKEKVIVNRERSANAYDVASYYVAKFIVETPINAAPAAVFSCVVYWIVGLNPDTFGYFILIVMLEALTGVSLGLAISCIAPNIDAAMGMAPAFVIVAMIFGGFYVNLGTLPIVANWIPYVSFLKWSFESLCINEFAGQTFTCDGSTSGACESTGEAVLERLAFSGESTGEAVMGLALLLIGFTVFSLLYLYFGGTSYLSLGWEGKNMKMAEELARDIIEIRLHPIHRDVTS